MRLPKFTLKFTSRVCVSKDIGNCFYLGRSMGGRTAAELASRLSHSGPYIFGVGCFSYPLHRPKKYDNLRSLHLTQLCVPLFIINGTNDEMCRKDLMDTLISQLSCDVSMHWVKEADHGLNVRGKPWDEVIGSVSELFVEWCKSVFTVERV